MFHKKEQVLTQMANPQAHRLIAMHNGGGITCRALVITPRSMVFPVRYADGMHTSFGAKAPVFDPNRYHLHIDHVPPCESARLQNGQLLIKAETYIIFRAQAPMTHAYQMLFPKRELYSAMLIPKVGTSLIPLVGDVIFAMKSLDINTWEDFMKSIAWICIAVPKADSSQHLKMLGQAPAGMNDWLRFVSCFTFPLAEASTIQQDGYDAYLRKSVGPTTPPDALLMQDGKLIAFNPRNPVKRAAESTADDGAVPTKAAKPEI